MNIGSEMSEQFTEISGSVRKCQTGDQEKTGRG